MTHGRGRGVGYSLLEKGHSLWDRERGLHYCVTLTWLSFDFHLQMTRATSVFLLPAFSALGSSGFCSLTPSFMVTICSLYFISVHSAQQSLSMFPCWVLYLEELFYSDFCVKDNWSPSLTHCLFFFQFIDFFHFST